MQKNLNIEEIAFKVVQMKFFAMHITNQKLSFDIFTVGNLQYILMKHDLYLISYWFWHKIKIYHFDPYIVLLAIATNIHVLLVTSFVVQGHIYKTTCSSHCIFRKDAFRDWWFGIVITFNQIFLSQQIINEVPDWLAQMWQSKQCTELILIVMNCH